MVLVAAVTMTNSFAARRAQFAVANVPFGIGSLAVPTAVPTATSVSWYCVAPRLLGAIHSDGVILENPTSHERKLLITSKVGHHRQHRVMLPHSSMHLHVTPGHGRVIVSSGGMVAFVETQTTSTALPQISPCSSSPSSHWTVEGLSTTTGTGSTVSVYNPFKVQAVVDLSYYSTQGEVSVPSVEGLIVRPGAVMTINAERFAPNAADISASVTARSGSVVVVSSVASPNTQETLGYATPSTHLYLPYVPTAGTKSLTLELLNTSSKPVPVAIEMAGFNGTLQVADMGPMHIVERVTVPANSPLPVDLTSVANTTGTQAVAVKVISRGAPLFGLGAVQSSSPSVPFYQLTPTFFRAAQWWMSCIANPTTHDPEVVFSRSSLISITGDSLAGGVLPHSTSSNILRPSVEPIGLAASTPSLFKLRLAHAMTVASVPLTEGCVAIPAA